MDKERNPTYPAILLTILWYHNTLQYYGTYPNTFLLRLWALHAELVLRAVSWK